MLVALHLSGLELRKIQSAVHHILEEVVGNLRADVFRYFALRLNRGRSQMWRGDEVVQFEKRRFRVRLNFKDIESGARDDSGFQRLVEVLFVDDAASCAIDETHA